MFKLKFTGLKFKCKYVLSRSLRGNVFIFLPICKRVSTLYLLDVDMSPIFKSSNGGSISLIIALWHWLHYHSHIPKKLRPTKVIKIIFGHLIFDRKIIRLFLMIYHLISNFLSSVTFIFSFAIILRNHKLQKSGSLVGHGTAYHFGWQICFIHFIFS